MPDPDRPRIAVINDNPDFLSLMSAILDDESGYAVTLFIGEKTGVDELVEAQPQLIIVDLLLGGASGWELVTLARADRRLAGVPIIVASADVVALRSRESELQRVGNIHVLAKPFGIDEMTDLVERLIGRGQPVGR